MTLKKNEYETLECQRKNNVYSETILTESVIGRYHTWEYSRLSRTRPKNMEFTIKEENYIDYKRRWCK